MTTAPARAHARRRHLLRALAASVALGAVGLTGPLSAPAAAAPQAPAAADAPINWYEIDLYNKINGVRWLSGVAPIFWHEAAGDQASAWSGQMARHSQLVHHSALSLEANAAEPGWDGYAEIIGRGPDVPSVLRAFMASPGHRAKILGDWRSMGVGVVASGGQLWVTVRFVR